MTFLVELLLHMSLEAISYYLLQLDLALGKAGELLGAGTLEVVDDSAALGT